jgi:3-oxoacyl-[acyl-carrier-protein] synthase II
VRVAITGYGLVCAVGGSVSAAWPKIAHGERGIGPLTLFDVTGQRSGIAAEVRDLQVPSRAEDRSPWSRSDAMALSAAREALGEARLQVSSARVGLIVGGTTGGMFETEGILARMHADPAARVPDPEMLAHPLSATVDRLQTALGPFARARSVCSACSSGANAFALGAAWLALGLVDAVLVGGTDGLCRLTYTGFNALGAVDPVAARPFDVRRRGLSIGEGSGFAVMERSSFAEGRGVDWAVELVGSGITSDAHHITNPAEDGVQPARAIELSLRHAGLTPADVDYVNAHGTGTPLNDAMEARAIALALGDETSRIYVSSTKSEIGHTLGAAGAIEAVIAALSVRDGRLPPTAGLEEIDPQCAGLRHVPQGGIDHPVRVALSNAFGFGGVDTVLAFARKGYARERSAKRGSVRVTGIGSASRVGALAGVANADLVASMPVVSDPTTTLDPARARRLDRSARLATIAASLAGATSDDGIVLGTSYGDTDGSASFLARIREKGPRMAPPAEFPNLVPSAPSGHASIYLGLHGPALTVADLTTSGEGAVATAWELVASGEVDSLVAGSVEAPSHIVEGCLAPVFLQAEREAGAAFPASAARTEGSAVIRLCAAADDSGVTLVDVVQANDGASVLTSIAAPGEHAERAVVVTGEANDDLRKTLARSAWASVPLRGVIGSVGRHEGLGGFALAAAAALLLRGDADRALVLGVAHGRSYGLLLRKT